MNRSIEKYMRARRSGAYVHPESKKIFDEGPVKPKTIREMEDIAHKIVKIKKEQEFKWNWKRIIWIVIILLGLLTAYRWYKDQPEKVAEVKESIVSQFENNDFFTKTKEIKVDREPVEVAPQPKPEIRYIENPSYVLQQKLAFEKLRAWERVTKEVVKRFFGTPVQSGYKRSLCISVDGNTKCKTVSSGGAILQKR